MNMKQGDFSTVAKYYHNRPAYSPLLLNKLLACVNDNNKDLSDFCIVEVGAGTGKLTHMLASLGARVLAVEPNDNMRAEGMEYTQHLPITWQKGSGEDTGVESSVADWVIMASSFHWTDPNKSLPEFSRILKNGGYFTAMWNPRHISSDSIFAEIEAEIKNIVPELNRVSSGAQNTKNWNDILVGGGAFVIAFLWNVIILRLWTKSGIWGLGIRSMIFKPKRGQNVGVRFCV